MVNEDRTACLRQDRQRDIFLKVGQKCPAFLIYMMYDDLNKEVNGNEKAESFDA